MWENLKAHETTLGEGFQTLEKSCAFVYHVLHAEQRHHLSRYHDTRLWHLYDTLLLARELNPCQSQRAMDILRRPPCQGYIAHHAGVMCALFGVDALPEPLRQPMRAAQYLRLRAHLNGTRLAALDRLAGVCAAGVEREAADLARQWRQPDRRRELIMKFLRPHSYARRTRNLIEWLKVQARAV
jgi:hypothetical protein